MSIAGTLLGLHSAQLVRWPRNDAPASHTRTGNRRNPLSEGSCLEQVRYGSASDSGIEGCRVSDTSGCGDGDGEVPCRGGGSGQHTVAVEGESDGQGADEKSDGAEDERDSRLR